MNPKKVLHNTTFSVQLPYIALHNTTFSVQLPYIAGHSLFKVFCSRLCHWTEKKTVLSSPSPIIVEFDQ